jgi:hypothetical protein
VLMTSFSGRDPMYGPAVRCKGISSIWQMRSCINVSGLWLEHCSRPSWISARVRSLYRTGLDGPFGSPVFACAGKTDPPSRLILSQTSAGKVWTTSSITPHLVQFLCSCRAAVPSSRPARADAPRARAVKAGRHAGAASRSGVSGPRLDGPEHGATLKPVGTPSHPSSRTRRRALC